MFITQYIYFPSHRHNKRIIDSFSERPALIASPTNSAMSSATAAAPVTLPASWFTSQPLYELERRGVFFKVSRNLVYYFRISQITNSQAWHILGPITRFYGHHDKVDYEIAQVKFTVQATAASKPGTEEIIAVTDDVSFQAPFKKLT